MAEGLVSAPGVAGDRPDGRRWRVELPTGTPFSLVEERTFTAAVPYKVADLPGLAASYSRVIVLPAAGERARR